ncbi:hypothetical protein AHiyo6_18440 [Arthrobacter sp. Hiyo6]|nr:hypothetical protein AHiyo6_18440 [Arthrobacter sp. Hiyo6]
MARNRVERMSEQPLHRAEPSADWRKLRAGDRVNVRMAPGYETAGLVDAVTGRPHRGMGGSRRRPGAHAAALQ